MKIILLGSSPSIMLQALILSQKYHDIEIHESKKKIGGSWKTSSFFKLKNVETGTHILAPWKNYLTYNESLNILKKKLGCKLFAVKPSPERIINKNINKSELKKIKYYYVKGGAFYLLKNIINLINKQNIKIYTNSKIKNIKFKNKKKILYTNKKIIYADQIYFPYYSNFDKNFIKKNNLSFKKKLSIHMILEFDNLKKFFKRFSYIQNSHFSKWVDRVSILDNKILLSDNLLYCMRVSEYGKKIYKSKPAYLAKMITYDLSKFLNFNPDNEKIKFKYRYYEYETAYRSKNDLQNFKKFITQKKLKLVDTSEFMKYIGKNISKLKKLKNYAEK